MDCKLCAKSIESAEDNISLHSEEAIKLNIQQIIRQHFPFELVQLIGLDSTIDTNTTINYICRSCCHIVCDFHELYIKVECMQKQEQLDASEHTDSDSEPLARLRNELKVELTEIKLEPPQLTVATPKVAVSENAGIRRSRRIVARGEKLNASQLQFEYQSLVPIDQAVDIKCEEDFSDRMDNDVLNEESYFNGTDTLDETNMQNYQRQEPDNLLAADADAVVQTPLSVKNLKKPSKKRRGRQKKCSTSPTPIKGPSSKTQISRAYDEFLADNFKLSCCICQDSIPDFTALKTHFRLKHDMRGYVLCCGKKLLKRGVLVDHIQTHIDPEYFKCPTCQKVAASRRCLELHMRLHEEQPERIYHCDICSKSYFRKSVFLRHTQMHAPDDEKKINCPQCEKVFVTTYMMNQHLKLVHLNMYAKVCEICGKSIRGREAFQRHQLEHKGAPKPLVQCDHCGIKLTNKYGLARHLKTMHTEENLSPQICSVCSKVSPTLSAHQRHMKYVHKTQRKHACRMCDKAFKRAQDLKEHMTTHTGEVLYTCPHCPRTFNSNANMYSHRKKFHRKEWEEKRKERFNKQSGSLLEETRRIKLQKKIPNDDELYSSFNSDSVEYKPPPLIIEQFDGDQDVKIDEI